MAGPRVSIGTKLGRWAVVLGFAALLAFPFYWMAITTFKQTSDLYDVQHNPFVFNAAPTLEHLRFLFVETLFLRWLWNTTLAGAAVVTITLLLAVPAAWALARLTGRWGQRLGIGIFLTYLIPPTLLFIPMSRVVSFLGLQDTLWAIIVTYPTFTVPFSIWLLMGFFKAIPRDLEDAALVDGLTRFGAFVRLVIPDLVVGDPHGGDLLLHPGDAGVRLCPHLHLLGAAPDGRRGRPHLPGARRRLLLGLADGGLPRGQPPHRAPLQPVPRSLHRRVHGRRGEVRGASPGRALILTRGAVEAVSRHELVSGPPLPTFFFDPEAAQI